MDAKRLTAIREGKRGLALALYIDIEDDRLEDYYSLVSSVLALDKEAGRNVLLSLQNSLETGTAFEITDDASDAVNLVLASELKDQILVARMLDSVCGRIDDQISHDLTPTG